MEIGCIFDLCFLCGLMITYHKRFPKAFKNREISIFFSFLFQTFTRRINIINKKYALFSALSYENTVSDFVFSNIPE